MTPSAATPTSSVGTALVRLPRGAVTKYKQYLNAQDTGTKHRHRAFHQRTRKYGDYLYAQDRERFMVDLRQWLTSKPNAQVTGPVGRLDRPLAD